MRRMSLLAPLWLAAMFVPYVWMDTSAMPGHPVTLDNLPERIGARQGLPVPFRPRQHAFLPEFERPGHQALSRKYVGADGAELEVQLFYIPYRGTENLLAHFPVNCLHGGYQSRRTASLPLDDTACAYAEEAELRGKTGDGVFMISWCQSADGAISPGMLDHLWWQYAADLRGRRTDCIIATVSITLPAPHERLDALRTFARECRNEVARLFAP